MTAEEMCCVLAKDARTGDFLGDVWKPCIRGLTESQVRRILDTFARGANASPSDFVRARRRLFPAPPCTECADTGVLWDGERYAFCGCDEGGHRRELHARLAAESEAARPEWARTAARHLEVVR